jgi:hypothetical protein
VEGQKKGLEAREHVACYIHSQKAAGAVVELLIAFVIFAAFPVAILIIAYWWGEPE